MYASTPSTESPYALDVGFVRPTTPPMRISVSDTPGTPSRCTLGQLSPDGIPDPNTVAGPVSTTAVVVVAPADVAVAAAVVTVAPLDAVVVAAPESSSSSPHVATTSHH